MADNIKENNMRWSTKYHYLYRYEYAGTNQHGARYKKLPDKRISVARLEAETDNANDLRNLILLSDHLNLPVRYDFDSDPHRAYIEVIGREALD
jgi:hypothetical protein